MEPWPNIATKHHGKKRSADRGRESGKRNRTVKGHDILSFKEGRKILLYIVKIRA